jgi:hypothetical protein
MFDAAVAVLVADLLPRSVGPYVSLMLVGFFVGILGHLARSKWLVAIGVALVFMAALLFPLARIATEQNPPPAPDPRLNQIP